MTFQTLSGSTFHVDRKTNTIKGGLLKEPTPFTEGRFVEGANGRAIFPCGGELRTSRIVKIEE